MSGLYGYVPVASEVDDSIEHQYRDSQPAKRTLRAKVKKTYFKTKQSIIEKIGKRQDQFVVDGDADVDSRLANAQCVRSTCQKLSWICSYYQKSLGELSDREQELADYLQSQATNDPTRAGSSMTVIGDGLEKEADSRFRCDAPLVRLEDELNTFHERAIGDMTRTTKQMEKLRRDYRAGLLWLRNASKQLDPEDHKQLTKYREAQTMVKESKKEFDRLKLDVSEKIEILGASYYSLLSNTLQPYYTAVHQVSSDNQRNFKELLKWSRSHQQHQYRLAKDVLEEQQEKLNEATPCDHKDIERPQRVDDSSLLTDFVSRSEQSNRPIVESEMEASSKLTVGDVLKHVSPDVSQTEDEANETAISNDGIKWQEFQSNVGSLPLMDMPVAMLEMREHRAAHDEEEEDDEHTSDDFFDPLLAQLLEREPSPLPSLEPEDEDNELDDEFTKLAESLAALQTSSCAQSLTDSDFLATLSQNDVILPSDLLDFDPSELSGLDFTPCLDPEAKEDGTDEIPVSESECTEAGKLQAQRAARAKSKASLSSWLNVFSHLDPLDNPDLLEGNTGATDTKDDNKEC